MTMAQQFTRLDAISESSIIKVRIMRIYLRTLRINYVKAPLEMILIDEHGTRIEATVQGNLRSKFFGRLHEFSTVIISNFGLAVGSGQFRFSQRPQKIFFKESTILNPCDDLPGSPHGFQFVDFATILATYQNLDEYLIDVMGEVIEYGDAITFTNKDITATKAENKPPKSRLIIKLEDHIKNVLSCTLWGEFATQMSDYIASFNGKRLIVILQFAKNCNIQRCLFIKLTLRF